MTMEMEIVQPEGTAAERIDKDQIIDFLTNNETICFKSQQRGENDLTKQEKTDIASEIYNKSKLNFLVRFGKYLQRDQLDFFRQFTQNGEERDEINIILKNYLEAVKTSKQVSIRNRRYEALQELIREDSSYFSEIEMMKRNPLLYDQLVGQYLTEEEREERDRIEIDEGSTLVKVLIEGIERDSAQVKRKEQENYEDEIREEEEDSDEEMKMSKPSHSQWGEYLDQPTAQSAKKAKTTHISAEERVLLKEEFISSMFEDFLDGKDDDFDYDKVDNNEKYDNNEVKDYDEEDKYFDSEEPKTIDCSGGADESEDELDIFMSGLDQHPGVSQLSEDIQKL